MDDPRVSVCVVTWNHERDVRACLESIWAQTIANYEVIVVDNASTDDTRKILREHGGRAKVILNEENRGFCGGCNQAIAASRADLVLLMNPDVVLRRDYLEVASAAIGRSADVGSLCGLLLLGPETDPDCRIDGTGLSVQRSRRMYLRDHGVRLSALRRDGGAVYGVDGALALYRREMIEDVSVDGEFFDEMFFAHKEVWDLSWRAQRHGWRAVFEPRCVATHRRNFRPGDRSVRKSQSARIRVDAVKNDFLMLIKNESIGGFLRDAPFIVGRQLGIFAYVMCCERESLRAYSYLLANWGAIRRKRQQTQLSFRRASAAR